MFQLLEFMKRTKNQVGMHMMQTIQMEWIQSDIPDLFLMEDFFTFLLITMEQMELY